MAGVDGQEVAALGELPTHPHHLAEPQRGPWLEVAVWPRHSLVLGVGEPVVPDGMLYPESSRVSNLKGFKGWTSSLTAL